MNKQKTQVVIVGGGPNGIAAAHYMGLYGIECVVLEVAREILPYPRAVSMDVEALRVLQGVGVAEPAVQDKLRAQYMDPVGNSPDEFRKLLAADVARWKPIVDKNKIALD